jgi:retron-type reverse transcriptase
MKATQENIEMIRKGFAVMQTKRDFLQLLNYAKPLVYGEKAQPFQIRQLSWYSSFKKKPKAYHTFEISKRSGSTRTIHAPKPGLKALQKTLAFILQCVYEPHRAAFGFVPNRSILQNAQIHQSSKYVFNVDLKDFFPSVDQPRVWACMKLPPFHLSKDKAVPMEVISLEELNARFTSLTEEGEFKAYETKYGVYRKASLVAKDGSHKVVLKLIKRTSHDTQKPTLGVVEPIRDIFTESNLSGFNIHLVNQPFSFDRSDMAGLIANICCTEMEVERLDKEGNLKTENRLVLPQGAPTSPVITNIVCRRLDVILTGVAKRFGLKYSRYADDITFSSMHDTYAEQGDFRKELSRVIKDQGFVLNDKKTRLQKQGFRQEVTGLVVNEKVNVNKKYIKDLRKWLYLWETYGIDRAKTYFEASYYKQESRVGKNIPDMTRVIEGKLNYLSMIKGKKDSTYLKLRERFVNLMREESNVAGILELWEKEGFEAAVEKFYSKQDGQ